MFLVVFSSCVKYLYYTTREPTKKTPYNCSTNTVIRSTNQTNGNFLFLVRRLNILWAINQGRSWRFVTLVFHPVLSDNDVFRKPTTPRLFKCLKNVLSFYVVCTGIVSLQYCIIIHGDKRLFCCLRKRNDFWPTAWLPVLLIIIYFPFPGCCIKTLICWSNRAQCSRLYYISKPAGCASLPTNSIKTLKNISFSTHAVHLTKVRFEEIYFPKNNIISLWVIW